MAIIILIACVALGLLCLLTYGCWMICTWPFRYVALRAGMREGMVFVTFVCFCFLSICVDQVIPGKPRNEYAVLVGSVIVMYALLWSLALGFLWTTP